MIHVTNGPNFLEHVAEVFELASKVIMVSGAGISTSAGIPGVRSESGLYNKGGMFNEASLRNPASRAELLKTALSLYKTASESHPTKSHYFIAKMRERGKPHRYYAQNIDMLEDIVCLRTDLDSMDTECVRLHGCLRRLRCDLCCQLSDWGQEMEAGIETGQVISCPNCIAACEARIAAGKRKTAIGQLRPNIILLGEHYPRDQISQFVNRHKTRNPDLLFILGTSVNVDGPMTLVRNFARTAVFNGGKVIYVNLSRPSAKVRAHLDSWVEWGCDHWARYMQGTYIARASARKRRLLGLRREWESRQRKKRGWVPHPFNHADLDVGSRWESPICIN